MAARSDRLQVDLVGEDLPQHLPSLDGLPGQEARYIADASAEPAGDLIDLYGGDLCQPLELYAESSVFRAFSALTRT